MAIRRVLMEKWDPIGVADVLQAQDEYDSYICGVIDLLQDQASREEIEEHLRRIESDTMGMTDADGMPLLTHPLRFEAVDELQRVFREQMLTD